MGASGAISATSAPCNQCGAPAVLSPARANYLRHQREGLPPPKEDAEIVGLEDKLNALPPALRILFYVLYLLFAFSVMLIKVGIITLGVIILIISTGAGLEILLRKRR